MKRFNIFTWILLFFLVIGILSSLRNNFLQIIIPLIIFGLIFYFYKNPNKLNFLRNKKYKDNHRNNQFNKNQRKSTFTVIDGKFKEKKNNNPKDKL